MRRAPDESQLAGAVGARARLRDAVPVRGAVCRRHVGGGDDGQRDELGGGGGGQSDPVVAGRLDGR